MNDVTFSPASLAVVTALVAALATAVTGLFRLLVTAKDEQIRAKQVELDVAQARVDSLLAQRRSLVDLADSASRLAAVAVADLRASRGQTSLAAIEPVVPEHQSPVTSDQEVAASLETVKALVAAAQLAFDDSQAQTRIIRQPQAGGVNAGIRMPDIRIAD